MSGGPDLASVRLEVRPVPGLKCIVIASVGMMHALAHVTTAADTPQPLTECELAIANRLVLTWNMHGKLRTTLGELVNWCREHTSPRDANSPHQLLVNASALLDEAAGGDSQSPGHAAVLQARYSQLLAMAQALRDRSWLRPGGIQRTGGSEAEHAELPQRGRTRTRLQCGRPRVSVGHPGAAALPTIRVACPFPRGACSSTE